MRSYIMTPIVDNKQRSNQKLNYKCIECHKMFSRFIGEACTLSCFYKVLLRRKARD